MKKAMQFLALIFIASAAHAEVKEYIRDHTYHAAEYDTEATSRLNAIDGVKRELLDELGTYVGSVIKINQDTLGNSYMSQDMVKITAGIVAMKLLNEKWLRPEYFVKASMKADPDDVLTKLKAMRADLELEKNLRNSYEELERARAELEELKAQLAMLKKTRGSVAALPVPAAKPDTVSVVQKMQKMEDDKQKELEKDLQEVKKSPVAPPPAAAVTPSRPALVAAPETKPASVVVAETKPSQAQVNAEQAQKDLERAAEEFKKAPPPQVVKVEPAKPPLEEKKLVASYQKAMQNIEVEEAFQRGLVAQIKGDFSTLVKEMAALAAKGYPRAQVHMGWIYERGIGVEQDYQKAFEWYEKAAANGAKNAPAHIGEMYEKGFGVKQDYLKAAEYYQRSIDLDGSLGYAAMGYLHETGKGVQFDRVKALEYYEKAIAKGDHKALALLGLMYQQGHGGLPRDEKKAVELYQQAIDHGIPLAMTRLGEMYNQGKGGLPQDRNKAMSLFLESARYRSPAAYAHLGRMYEEGWATKQDYAEARKWYEQAAEHDAIYAMVRLGFIYKDGLGVKRDWDKATDWFKKAASLGNDKAEEMLKKRANWR